jgi:hypothetical protein
VRANYEAAQKLQAIAGAPPAEPQRRMARGSVAPQQRGNDPTWTSLFLDNAELPYFTKREEQAIVNDATFSFSGGTRAGYVAWIGQESWPMWHVVDTRWLFPTTDAADQYLRTVMPVIGDGLPTLHAPQLGDVALAFGGAEPGHTHGTRYAAQCLVIRVGRLVMKLFVVEGPTACASGTPLDETAMLALAHRAIARAQWMLSRYWLTVGRGSDAATMFAQMPNARLFTEYPILALPEFPAAMATLGDAYAPHAQVLWQIQTQLRSQQWSVHRDATRALVRTLLDDRASDQRVNAAHAYALIHEMRKLDPDPMWAQLEAECRAVYGS